MMTSKPTKKKKLNQSEEDAKTSKPSELSFLQGSVNDNNSRGKDNNEIEDSIMSNDVGAHYDAVVQDLQSRGLFEVATIVKQSNPRGKRDPVTMLNDNLCCEVFSYLCEKPETEKYLGKSMTKITWLRSKAGSLYFQLRSVSRKWKTICLEAIPWSDWVGLVDLTVQGEKSIHSASVQSYVGWLIQHKIRLGALHFYESISLDKTKDFELLTNLFENCPLDDLLHLRCYTQHLREPHFSSEDNQGHRLKKLHDLIARKCPNLKSVNVSLMLPNTTPIYSDYISCSLFSISSIEYLDLWVGFYGEKQQEVDPELVWGAKTPIDGQIFTKIIRTLPKLVELEIYGKCATAFNDERGRKIRFHVASPTLKRLISKDWGAVLSVDCPALKEFHCNGGADRNTNNCTHGDISRQQFSVAKASSRPAQYKAEQFLPSDSLQVPAECKLVVHDMREWRATGNGYARFKEIVTANENAPIHSSGSAQHESTT